MNVRRSFQRRDRSTQLYNFSHVFAAQITYMTQSCKMGPLPDQGLSFQAKLTGRKLLVTLKYLYQGKYIALYYRWRYVY